METKLQSMSWTLMRSWIKLIVMDSKTVSPLSVRDRTYCYDSTVQREGPAQQISLLFYIWKVCRFCPQQRNSQIFLEMMKTVGKYSISRRSLELSQLTRFAGPSPLAQWLQFCWLSGVQVMVPGSVQSLNHDQTIFVFIRAGTRRTRPGLPGLASPPALACPRPRQTLGRSEEPKQ